MAVPAEPYDLVIIRAGIAGLNALFGATQTLPANASILLVDVRDAPGGMWNTVYDYVRLHQPNPFFTMGAEPWGLDKSPHYLAGGNEVQSI